MQLGLRGEALAAYGKQEIVEIIDMSEFVAREREQRANLSATGLVMPLERVYTSSLPAAADAIGLDPWPE